MKKFIAIFLAVLLSLAIPCQVLAAELTEAQMAVVDTDRSGTIEEAEYQAIYQIYIGG